jgi:Family of unknown function (DUF5677)
MENWKILSGYYQSLENEVRETSKFIPISTPRLQIIAAAALVKNFEFNLCVTNQDTEATSFFLQPTLRGLCEDAIVLKYLIEKIDNEDANLLIDIWMSQQTLESIDKQSNFFCKNRPLQPILSRNVQSQSNSPRPRLNPLRQKLNSIKIKYGWQQDKDRPSVSHMAKACGLDEVYDYIYAATSRTVHFSPSVLFRMGWGPENPDQLYTSSTAHFNGFYAAFNVFYGSYLFVLIYEIIKSRYHFTNDFHKLITMIKEELDKWPRWPEMITFEEMNVPKPNAVVYALSVVMNEQRTKKTSQ